MTATAESLVQSAKDWASSYGSYSNGVEGAALTAVLRVRAAWDASDPDAFADMFIDNGSMLVGDVQLMDRDEIREYVAGAFAAAWGGTRLIATPLEIRLLDGTSAVVVTEGGIVRDGGDAPAEAEEVRTVWIVVKRDGDWYVASYQTSPIHG